MSDIMEKLEGMKASLEAAIDEASKLVDKGNKAAAARARKALKEIMDAAKELRKKVQEHKESLKS